MKKINGFNLNLLDEETMEGPIVQSLLEDDFYKFPMGQFVWDHSSRDAAVCWHFKNRTTDVKLARYISEDDFMKEIDSLQHLRLDSSEHHYLRGTFEYDQSNDGRRMFSDQYLSFLCNEFEFPRMSFSHTNDGQLAIKWKDRWVQSSLAEIPVLKIVNTLYYRSQLKKMSRLQREAIYAKGILNLLKKVEELRRVPFVSFSDFGNRRRFSAPLHRYIVERLAEELPKQFKGTSNTRLAMEYGLMPVGTCAHEISMVTTALGFYAMKSLGALQETVQKEWNSQFGYPLSIALPDTYGTEYCINSFSNETIRNLKGFRIDSMDPMLAIPLLQARYTKAGVDFRDRMFIPSDGLTVPKMIAISSAFKGQGIISHGLGTHLTNDVGMPTLSIVCKAYSASGMPCVKLSDNIAKATGEPAAVERYKIAAGYTTTVNEKCEV
jgi:nicotinate phosphoribosyltransferase